MNQRLFKVVQIGVVIVLAAASMDSIKSRLFVERSPNSYTYGFFLVKYEEKVGVVDQGKYEQKVGDRSSSPSHQGHVF